MERTGRTVAVLLLAGVGCATGPDDHSSDIGPITAVAGTANVLSATVTIEVGGADSLMVQLGPSSGTTFTHFSPVVPVTRSSMKILVLGLEAETEYRLSLVAWRGSVPSGHDGGTVTTGSLPADLPAYRAGGYSPGGGFVAFAAGAYGLVIDNSGRVVWYHRFPNGPGLNFMAQPNGRYVARPSTPDPNDLEPWIEVDPAGQVTRTLRCAGGLVSRPHDMLALEDGSYWLLCDEVRTVDLSPQGGHPQARVTGTAVQHVGAGGDLRFQWTAFDHFAIEDLAPDVLSGATINWTHGNALDLAPDGTLVVSFRNLNEVTGIDSRSGAVRWRLGGVRSDFAFVGATGPPFRGQHGVRITGQEIQLLDNLGHTAGSRVERYRLDFGSRTASLVAAFAPGTPVVAQLGGTTQALDHGHTLASYGNGGRVEEYDASGNVVWEILGNPGYVFRAQRIRSLYAPGAGDR